MLDFEKSNKVRSACLLVVFYLLSINNAFAQVTQKRFMPVGGTIMPFDVEVAPATPDDFAVALVLPYGVDATWSVSQGTQNYVLEYLPPNTTNWTQVNVGTDTNYTIAGLDIGTYTFRVSACGGGLCSEYSSNRVIELVYQSTADEDADGIIDSFDLCADTQANTSVDLFGCSASQVASGGGNGSTTLDSWCRGTPTGDYQGTSCDAQYLDTDGDGDVDSVDPYPLQPANMCSAP